MSYWSSRSNLSRIDKISIIVPILLFCLPSLLAITFQFEYWPFSKYDMYSYPLFNTPKLAHQVLITADNRSYELRDVELLFPLGPHCLNQCVRKLSANPNGMQHLLAYYIQRCTKNPDLCRIPQGAKLTKIELFRLELHRDASAKVFERNKNKVDEYVAP